MSSTDTTTTGTAAPTPSLASQFITNLFANLFKDEAAVLQPVADTYLNQVISDPAPDNLVAQSLAYQAQAAAVLPKVESVGVLDTATAIKNFIDAQVPALVAKVTAQTQTPSS
ncbi:MAG: hypothetical protein WAL34_04100 [Acidobacteriaceae bacterium]